MFIVLHHSGCSETNCAPEYEAGDSRFGSLDGGHDRLLQRKCRQRFLECSTYLLYLRYLTPDITRKRYFIKGRLRGGRTLLICNAAGNVPMSTYVLYR
jgi:hypothetical protein